MTLIFEMRGYRMREYEVSFVKVIFFVVSFYICTMTRVDAAILDNAYEYNGHFYKIFEREFVWEDAKYYCQSMGGYLFVADSRAENDAIKNYISKNQQDEKKPKCYWIGAEIDPRGFWRWINGKIVLYYDWIQGSPASHGKVNLFLRPVVENEKVFWKWAEYWGADKKFGFICEWDNRESAHESNW